MTRPLSDEGMKQFEQFFCSHSWDEVINEQCIDRKVTNFHNTVRSKLDEIFPEKVVFVSYLDKKWMNPQKSKESFTRKEKVKSGEN
jgi:hypothetical protein